MATLLPPLPKAITKSIRNPVALTTKDITQRLRTQQRPLSASDHADALDKHQDYLDALQSDIGSIQDYLQAASTTSAGTSEQTQVWSQSTGTPFTY